MKDLKHLIYFEDLLQEANNELVARAEDIARERGYGRIRVTSGVGVRRYYASLGYGYDLPYMAKNLRSRRMNHLSERNRWKFSDLPAAKV